MDGYSIIQFHQPTQCFILTLNSTGPHWSQKAIIIHNLLILKIQKTTMATNSHSKLIPKQKQSTAIMSKSGASPFGEIPFPARKRSLNHSPGVFWVKPLDRLSNFHIFPLHRNLGSPNKHGLHGQSKGLH